MIVLETAQPVKFADVVTEATGVTPTVPARLAGLEDLPRRFEVLPDDVTAITGYLEKHAVTTRN